MTKENKKLNDCQQQLKDQVDGIINAIENCEYDFDKEYSDYDEPCAGDYVSDILDINYIITSDKSYIGIRLTVAFGGPNIYIDTFSKQVQGYWGSDEYIKSYFNDELGIDDYFEEYYNCI